MALYEKMFYLNENIDYLVNKEIIEYDMSSGGFNICKELGLLNTAQIERLERMSKKDRQIQLGLYQRKDKSLSKKLNDGFKLFMKKFYKENGLKDEDVLSIKKDAIFVLRGCEKCEFGHVLFRPKNTYTSYYHLDGKEIYYNQNTLDVKGISDDNLKKHEEYMVAFLSNIFRCNESNSDQYARKTLKEFSDYYKNRALEIGYYREFNTNSVFRLKDEKFYGDDIGIDSISSVKDIDISYNFTNIIIPLVTILI